MVLMRAGDSFVPGRRTSNRRQVRAELQDLRPADGVHSVAAETRQQVLVQDAAHCDDVRLAPADFEVGKPLFSEFSEPRRSDARCGGCEQSQIDRDECSRRR